MLTIEKLKEIIYIFNHGDRKALIKQIIAEGINLSVSEEMKITEVQKYILKKIEKEVADEKEKIREKEARNSDEEKQAKKIIIDGNTKKSYYEYDIDTLQTYQDTIKSLIESPLTTNDTKRKLSKVLEPVEILIADYTSKRNNKEEKVINRLTALYYSGKKDEAFRILLQDEPTLYRMSNTKAISTITKKRFARLYKEYKVYADEQKTEHIVKGVLAILKSSHNSLEENKEAFSQFYKMCHKKFSEGNLDKYLTEKEDYSLIQGLIEKLKEVEIKERLLKERGYSDDRLQLLDDLLDRYINNKSINNHTHKIGIDNRTISKTEISMYLIKFETEPMISGERLETFKKFAEEYGNRLLTWIILRRNIGGTDGIPKEEIVSYCKMSDYKDGKTLQKRIEEIEKHLSIKNKSLYQEEKESLRTRINDFIGKYESSKASQKIKGQ